MCINKTEVIYERSCVNVKVEPCSTFTFTRDTLYIASILFTCVCTKTLRDSAWKPTLIEHAKYTRVHEIATRDEGDTQKREERTYLALECRLSRALAYYECSLSLRTMTSRTYIIFFVTEISRLSRMFKYNLQRLCPVFQRFCAWEGKNEASFHKDPPRTSATMTPTMKERRSLLLSLVCLRDNGD